MNQNVEARPDEYVLKFSRGNGGQVENANLRIPLNDDDILAEIVRRAMRDGLP